MTGNFTDIHCHILPGIDDGSTDVATSLAMAKMAVEDGIHTIIATPHQLDRYAKNHGDDIRRFVADANSFFADHNVPLTILPGGDIRIEDDLIRKIRSGAALTLADKGRHILLELPHELYFPLEPVLDQLSSDGITGILSHPERNAGILRTPNVLAPLVDRGCLMQVTAGSLLGSFGSTSQKMAEWMILNGLVHFIATDAHGLKARKPLLKDAFLKVAAMTDEATAVDLFCNNPAAVAAGGVTQSGCRVENRLPTKRSWRFWGKAS